MAGFSNPVKNRVLESYSNIFFLLAEMNILQKEYALLLTLGRPKFHYFSAMKYFVLILMNITVYSFVC